MLTDLAAAVAAVEHEDKHAAGLIVSFDQDKDGGFAWEVELMLLDIEKNYFVRDACLVCAVRKTHAHIWPEPTAETMEGNDRG